VEDFGAIPNITNESGYDNYTIINVTPSVIPNPYVPSFRIFAYNNTGVEVTKKEKKKKKKKKKGSNRKHGHRHGHGDKESECKKSVYKDTWRCRLKEGWHSSSDAPSRRNVQWSPLGYAQVRERCE
jgi:endopolyphosphatase